MASNDVTPRMARHLALERKLAVLRLARELEGAAAGTESEEELRLMLEGERLWREMTDEEQDRLDREGPLVVGFPTRAVAQEINSDWQFIARVRQEEIACT